MREAELAISARWRTTKPHSRRRRPIFQTRMESLDNTRRGPTDEARRILWTSEAQWRGTWKPSQQPATTRTPFSRLERFEEAKSLQRKTMPVMRRVLGENHEVTLKMRKITGSRSTETPGATLDDLREAVIRSRTWDGRGTCLVARTRQRD